MAWTFQREEGAELHHKIQQKNMVNISLENNLFHPLSLLSSIPSLIHDYDIIFKAENGVIEEWNAKVLDASKDGDVVKFTVQTKTVRIPCLITHCSN